VDLTNPQSLNRYAYVMNNPLTFVDLMGLAPCAYDFCVTGWGNLPPGNGGGGSGGNGTGGDTGCTLVFIASGSAFGFGGGLVANVSPGCGGGGGGGGGGGTSSGGTPGISPRKKINLCNALQRARLVAQAGLSVGVVYLKVQGAALAFAAAPATGGASAAGTAYLIIGAGGNIAAAGIQLAGAFTGNIKGADQGAATVTTVSTASGFITLVASGNPEKAATVAGFESLATTGVNGGMTGRLIDEGLMGASKLLGATDIGQNIFDLLGIDAGCGGG
jgi:hypothetical protein